MSAEEESGGQPEYERVPEKPGLALAGGLAAAVIGSVLWAAITVATKRQIGFMAVGMGLLVGFAVRYLGQGSSRGFGWLGAGISLFGCLLGNLFAQIGFYSAESGQSIVEVWTSLNFRMIPQIMTGSFQAMDALFYGIAVYEGFRFSVNKPEALVRAPGAVDHLEPAYPRSKAILALLALGVLVGAVAVAVHLPNRTLTIRYPDSEAVQCCGSIRWGQPHGRWQYWNADGSQQGTVEWRKGRREGPSLSYNADGSLLKEESYHCGLLHGPARTYGQTGGVASEGQYTLGRMSGPWTAYDGLGQPVSRGNYHLDRENGQWTYWHPGGGIAARGCYERGAQIGVWEHFYESGSLQRRCEYDGEGHERILESRAPDGRPQVREGSGYYRLHDPTTGVVLLEGRVVNGRMVGKWLSRRANGSRQQESLYEGEQRLLLWAWDPQGNPMVAEGTGEYVERDESGQLAYRAPFEQGRLSGTVTLYYPDGSVLQSVQYAAGRQHGRVERYFVSGQKAVEGRMENGLEVGEWTWWCEDGSVESIADFVEGKKQGEQRFWDDGELLKTETYEAGELVETVLE